MFSDHLQKIDRASGKTMLLLASGLVIACQLVAMVIVSQGQVDKAYSREVTEAIKRTAIAECVESRYGVELNGCTNHLTQFRQPITADSSDMHAEGYLAVAYPSRK